MLNLEDLQPNATIRGILPEWMCSQNQKSKPTLSKKTGLPPKKDKKEKKQMSLRRKILHYGFFLKCSAVT